MDLVARFKTQAGESLESSLRVRHLSIRREVGKSVVVMATVDAVPVAAGGSELLEIAQKAAGDALTVTIVDEDGGDFQCPSGLFVGFERVADHLARIKVDCTGGVYKNRMSVHRPRWRVHRCADLEKLAKEFEDAAVLNRSLGAAWARIGFPDGGDACVIQGGLSNWEMLLAIAQHAPLDRASHPYWWPAVPTGELLDELTSAYVVESMSAKAHEQWNTLQDRRVDGDSMGGVYSVHIGGHEGHEPVPVDSALCVLHRWARREFDQRAFVAWLQRPLPQFVGQASTVYAIQDELYDTGLRGRVWWDTSLETLPTDTARVLFHTHQSPRAWIGVGAVRDRDATGPWITVDLPGFAQEKNENLLRVRVSTPYGGHDGAGGINLIPELNTHVTMCWSGAFEAPVTYLGNLRVDGAAFPSPSMHLEDPWQFKSSSGHVHEVGEIEIESDLQVVVSNEVQIRSAGAMEMEGDGGHAVLRGGKLQTGRA